MRSAICCPGQLDRADQQDTRAADSVNVIGTLAQPNRVVLRRVDFRFEIASFHPRTHPRQIGSAPCRESVCQYVSISMVPVSLKPKHNNTLTHRTTNSAHTTKPLSTHTPLPPPPPP